MTSDVPKRRPQLNTMTAANASFPQWSLAGSAAVIGD